MMFAYINLLSFFPMKALHYAYNQILLNKEVELHNLSTERSGSIYRYLTLKKFSRIAFREEWSSSNQMRALETPNEIHRSLDHVELSDSFPFIRRWGAPICRRLKIQHLAIRNNYCLNWKVLEI